MDQSISLNKFISDTGYCSRREADQLITQGRVLLNDKPAALGNRYKPGDTVEVDGSLITAAKKDKCVYLALNKPPGITTTTELHVKDNIISFVNYPKRIFPIGRLDKDSEGLIFLTNDGDIINKILRADNNHEKEYVVRVDKAIDTAFLQKMSQGVPILDTVTLPCKVQMVGRQSFRITLTQGLNRQIRRMCEYLGYNVTGLQRVRIMNVKLDKLALGKWRHLTETELANLKETIADSSKVSNEGKAAKRKKAVDISPEAEADKTAGKAKEKEDKPTERFWEKKKPAGNAWWSDKKGDKKADKPGKAGAKSKNNGDRSRQKDKPAERAEKNGAITDRSRSKDKSSEKTGKPHPTTDRSRSKDKPTPGSGSGRPGGGSGKSGESKKTHGGAKAAPSRGNKPSANRGRKR